MDKLPISKKQFESTLKTIRDPISSQWHSNLAKHLQTQNRIATVLSLGANTKNSIQYPRASLEERLSAIENRRRKNQQNRNTRKVKENRLKTLQTLPRRTINAEWEMENIQKNLTTMGNRGKYRRTMKKRGSRRV